MPTMNTKRDYSFPEVPTFEFVIARLKTILLDSIQEAIAEGVLHVLEYKKWRAETSIDYALAPNLVRHIAKQFLIDSGRETKGEEETDGRLFEAEDIPNNGLCMTTAGFVVRILKSSEDGSVPAPGVSQARQNFYKHNQAILNFFPDENESERIQPPYHLVVHWTVDSNYNLLKVSIALPFDYKRNDNGKLDVLCLFDEPYWTRPPESNVTSINQITSEPVLDNDLAIEPAAEEKTGKGSRN